MSIPIRLPVFALCLLGAAAPAPAQSPAPSQATPRKAGGAAAKKTPAPSSAPEPATERQKILYAMGARLGLHLGMTLLDLLPPAKHLLARVGMGLAGPQPRLGRGLPIVSSATE